MRIYYDTEAKSALQFKSELSRLRNAELAPPLATPTPIGEKVLPHLAIQGMSVEGTKSMKAPSPSLYRWDDWGPKRFSVWPKLKQATWTQVFRSQVQSSAHCSTTFFLLSWEWDLSLTSSCLVWKLPFEGKHASGMGTQSPKFQGNCKPADKERQLTSAPSPVFPASHRLLPILAHLAAHTSPVS